MALGAPKAPAQGVYAVSGVGGVRGGQTAGLPIWPVLRPVPGLARWIGPPDMAGAQGGREAVRGLSGPACAAPIQYDNVSAQNTTSTCASIPTATPCTRGLSATFISTTTSGPTAAWATERRQAATKRGGEPGNNRASRFGAAPLLPCPTGSPPEGGHGCAPRSQNGTQDAALTPHAQPATVKARRAQARRLPPS